MTLDEFDAYLWRAGGLAVYRDYKTYPVVAVDFAERMVALRDLPGYPEGESKWVRCENVHPIDPEPEPVTAEHEERACSRYKNHARHCPRCRGQEAACHKGQTLLNEAIRIAALLSPEGFITSDNGTNVKSE